MLSFKTFTRFFIILYFFISIAPWCLGDKTSDSLTAIIKNSPDDTSKVRMLAKFSYALASSQPQEASLFGKQAVELARKLNFREGEALGCNRLGLSLKILTQYDSAFYYFFLSNRIYSSLKNTDGEINTFINIGTLHERLGLYDSASYYLFKSLELAEAAGNEDLEGSALNNMALVFRKQGKTDDAIAYNLRALEIHQKKGNVKSIAIVNENLGICYIDKKDFARSKKYFDKALETYNSLDDKRALGRVNINLSDLLHQQGRYTDALDHASTAMGYYIQTKNQNGISFAYSSMADISRELKKYGDAVKYALKSLEISIETGNHQNELDTYRLIQKIYSEQGNYRLAYEYLSKASVLNDSLFNEKKETIITEFQTKYETEKKEKEIQLLNKDNEIKSIAIKKQQVLRNSLIGGTVLIIIIGLLLFNRYRISQQQKLQAERVRISSDLHDEIGSTLSSISMYSAYAKEKPAEAGNILEEISSSSQEMIDDMNDIIWAINPRNDSFAHIIDRLRNYASRMAQSKNIALHFSGNDSQKNISLTMDQRKNFYLICKETFNNAVKYAECKNLFVNIDFKKNILLATIEDDGKGFETENIFEGNGLKNMKYRADQIKANFSISSIEGKGTKASVEIKIS